MLGAAWQFANFLILIHLEYHTFDRKETQHVLVQKGPRKLPSAPSLHLPSHAEAKRGGEVVCSGNKAEWGAGQKWILLILFPLSVFRVAFNFRLGSHSVLILQVVTSDLPFMHSDSPFAKDVCFGHIFPGAVMDWHRDHWIFSVHLLSRTLPLKRCAPRSMCFFSLLCTFRILDILLKWSKHLLSGFIPINFSLTF